MTHTDTSLNGIDPDTTLSVSEEKRNQGLSYVSKSRVKLYRQCKYKFFNKYYCEERPPSTMATERGSIVHRVFEKFHENLKDFIEEYGRTPKRFTPLMPRTGNETQFLDYISSFWKFELRRLEEAKRSISFAESRVPGGIIDVDQAVLEAWEPLEVEAEFWMGEPPEGYEGEPNYVDPEGPPVGDIPWMGKADVVLNSASVPGVTGSGVTILDYKTGDCPTIKYEGAPFLDEVMNDLFLECEFYSWLSQSVYDVDAVAIYYPRDDELVVGEQGVKERRFDIKSAALGMQELPAELNEDGEPKNFERDESPLCHWGQGKCWYYDICSSEVGKE